MQSVFTTFASSRFVDREAVVAALRKYAGRLKARQPAVVAVYLFGSFAKELATPHSDADVMIKVSGDDADLRQGIWDEAFTLFLRVPVPVDLFVISAEQLAQGARDGSGIAGVVAREGLRLA